MTESVGDYVDFGDHVRNAGLGQCQYVSRYVDGRHNYPNLGDGLRFIGSPDDYHALMIHADDVDTFIERVKDYRLKLGRTY